MSAPLTDYRIVRGDTLEAVALAKLGSPMKWRLLASLNRLRYPFISDDPIAQYGSPLFTAVTTAPVSVNDTTYTVSPVPTDLIDWTAGNIFYIQKANADGTVTFDALTLRTNIDPATGVVTFTTGFVSAYATGTGFNVFARQKELQTHVLRTGDVLHIPSGIQQGVTVAVGSDQFLDLLGTDIALDASGQVTLTTNGDLTLVSGIANLEQALRLRLNTPVGTRLYDPNYGNQAFDHVGESSSDYFFNLMSALVSRCIVADSRVSSVHNVVVTQKGATVSVDATVELRTASQLLRLDNIVLRLIGGL